MWNNSLLTWDPALFGGLDILHVSAKDVWVPDILLFYNVDEQDQTAGGRTTYKTDVIMYSNGTNKWRSPALLKSICKIKVKFFPFDSQTCKLKFGSFSHDITTLDMSPMNLTFPTRYYQKNGEWSIYDIDIVGSHSQYNGFPNQFADVTLTIWMRRESLDYFINLIIPCCLISSMIFLGFVLPPESGERIGLSITVLLAMTVFQQLTSEIMPAYDFPLLGQYYFAIVLEIGASLVVTTMILNFYHRTNRKMPQWLRTLILNWTSRVVLLHDVVVKTDPRRQMSFNPAAKRRTMHKSDNQSANIVRARSMRQTRRKKDPEIGDEGGFELAYPETFFANDNHNENKESDNHHLNRNNNFSLVENRSMRENRVDEGAQCHQWDYDAEISEEERCHRHWEWTLAAKILDRFVLCVAVVLGIVTVGAIFLRAPSLWDRPKELEKEYPKYI
ncbi:neuronal acetylcholine receptor subunit alpha-2 isoform X2 [Nematostella vectensis]|nr:neuronal acetylcholine receptor subunit alpha-2 isoform X2 [Nematostella vectensis]